MTKLALSCPCCAPNNLTFHRSVRFLDVRTAEEFAEGHAANAINVPVQFGAAHGSTATPEPNSNFLSQVQELVRDTDAPLVCHCLHGRRGAQAAEQLAAGGFKDVVNVQGGLTALQQAGLPVEKS